MLLAKARIKKYRSIRDSGWFEIDAGKTILVGPNEAGKTVILQALQQINPTKGTLGFDPLRDYPRSEYNDITTGKVKPADITVVEAHFNLEEEERKKISINYRECTYVFGKKFDNSFWHRLEGGIKIKNFSEIEKDLIRLAFHIDNNFKKTTQQTTGLPSEKLASITSGWNSQTIIDVEKAKPLLEWLKSNLAFVEEENSTEGNRIERLRAALNIPSERIAVLDILHSNLPIFVYYNNYFRVKPNIHLEHLASRLENNTLDDKQYDYGNQCLLKLLGFTARELSNLGKAPNPLEKDIGSLNRYRDQLDKRSYQLNAASTM